MSKRLICTERPLAALGREDVMKRVFFSYSVGRNLLLRGLWWVVWGFKGWTWPVGQLQQAPPRTITLKPPTSSNCPVRKNCHLSSLTWERTAYTQATGFNHCKWDGGTWGHYVGTCPGTCLLSALSRLWGWSAGYWCGPLFVLCCLKRGKFKCCSYSGMRADGQAARVS